MKISILQYAPLLGEMEENLDPIERSCLAQPPGGRDPHPCQAQDKAFTPRNDIFQDRRTNQYRLGKQSAR